MSQPFRSGTNRPSAPFVRVNGKIRAREVRVVEDQKQLGILSIGDALTLARSRGVDLVEIAPNAEPPVCRLVDYGKYRYEQSKKDKESRKHQHASLVKEIQLRPAIDPHDLGVKAGHAIGFLCEDMKVKVCLRFRGREMAHTDIGFQVVRNFIEKIVGYGTPDFEPKLNGKTIVLMISPLPKNKRAKHPEALAAGAETAAAPKPKIVAAPVPPATAGAPAPSTGFTNNPFSQLGPTGS